MRACQKGRFASYSIFATKILIIVMSVLSILLTVIKFRALRSYKICSEECKQCAKDADLSTAIYCSFKCNGNPTFCYPKEMWFGHHKCYQSTRMYGMSGWALKISKSNLWNF